MRFQVVNGNIPEVVERFLRNDVGIWLWQVVGRDWVLSIPGRHRGRRMPFDWPHDREPTLQDAIEAVMRATP